MRDVKLFVSELEKRTSLLIMVSVDKSFEMVFRFSHLCGFGCLSLLKYVPFKNQERLKRFRVVQAVGRALNVFSQGLKLTYICHEFHPVFGG